MFVYPPMQEILILSQYCEAGHPIITRPAVIALTPLQWHHNGLDSVSNHQPNNCLLSRLFGRRSKKTSKVRVTGLCAGNSPGTGEFPAQRDSNTENVSIWWRHHVIVAWWRHMATWNLVNIGSGNGLLPDRTKPLPEPMLTYHWWGPLAFISGQYH